mmetsp:Transcript_32424/g.89635  ORF Transcript_32424/g.89635 Transcript_32424/m.89635 type:complete len:333 (+) Transcript_32424:1009-2007(+)
MSRCDDRTIDGRPTMSCGVTADRPSVRGELLGHFGAGKTHELPERGYCLRFAFSCALDLKGDHVLRSENLWVRDGAVHIDVTTETRKGARDQAEPPLFARCRNRADVRLLLFDGFVCLLASGSLRGLRRLHRLRLARGLRMSFLGVFRTSRAMWRLLGNDVLRGQSFPRGLHLWFGPRLLRGPRILRGPRLLRGPHLLRGLHNLLLGVAAGLGADGRPDESDNRPPAGIFSFLVLRSVDCVGGLGRFRLRDCGLGGTSADEGPVVVNGFTHGQNARARLALVVCPTADRIARLAPRRGCRRGRHRRSGRPGRCDRAGRRRRSCRPKSRGRRG